MLHRPELPDLGSIERRDDLFEARLAALEALVSGIERQLTAGPFAGLTPIEDLSLLHVAKAAGTTRSAAALMREGGWTDACILARAVFEQLFTYLWVVRDPERAEARHGMVSLKQAWANAQYLDRLAANAEPAARGALLEEAAAYRAAAKAQLAELAASLGVSEKQVRDEAMRRASEKAIEVAIDPAFSLPYAHYSGCVHSDGNALAVHGADTPEGRRYNLAGAPPAGTAIASDLHRALLRLLAEAQARTARLTRPEARALREAHAAWLAEADDREQALAIPDL